MTDLEYLISITVTQGQAVSTEHLSVIHCGRTTGVRRAWSTLLWGRLLATMWLTCGEKKEISNYILFTNKLPVQS